MILLILLGILILGIHLIIRPDFFNTPDTAIYADIARTFLQGHGFSSHVTLPILTNYNHLTPDGTWPPYYPLLFPITLVMGFIFLGISDLTVAIVSGFFFIVTIPIIYLFTKQLFGKDTSIIACVWYIFSPQLLAYSIVGMTEPLFTFLVTLSVYLLFLTKPLFFLSGIMVGLAYLTKFQGILLLPALSLFILWNQKAKKISSLGYFLGGILLVIILKSLFLPPLAQEYSTPSNSVFWSTVADGALYLPYQFGQSLKPITLTIILNNFSLIVIKCFQNFYYFLQQFFLITSPPILVFYIFSYFQNLFNKKQKQLTIVILGLFITFLLFHILTLFNLRYFYPLIPLITIVAASVFLTLLKKSTAKHHMKTAFVFTILFIIIPSLTYPGLATSFQRSITEGKPTVNKLIANFVENNTDKKDTVTSSNFAHIAWYAKRRTISLPIESKDVAQLQKKIPIDVIVLYRYPPMLPLEGDWQNLLDHPHAFNNFRFVKELDIKPEDNYYRVPVKIVMFKKK